MYDVRIVSDYYNDYGSKEWDRLDASAHARLIYYLHKHFLSPYLAPGISVLDAGCGAGRFSVDIAQAGASVSLVDISAVQIALAKQKLQDKGLWDKCLTAFVADIHQLAMFKTNTFNITICYGGVLNYLLNKTENALLELVRITKPGGILMVSVMSRWGVFRYIVGNQNIDPGDFLGRPKYWQIPQVIETGDFAAHPDMQHPARHFFTAAELHKYLKATGLEQIQLATAPSISAALYDRLNQIEMSKAAWNTLTQLEEQAYCCPGLVDTGEFLMAKGIVCKE